MPGPARGPGPLFGGLGLVVPSIVEVFTLGAPVGSLTFSIPDAPGLCGAVVYLQTLQENSGGPQGFALSPGLKLTLGS